MIFLTVGTQFPFDRLVSFVDSFAKSTRQVVVSQVGNSNYESEYMEVKRFLSPDEINNAFSKAKVIVSHAGMGSIINCLRLKKTIIIFPRLSKFGEHRNDHQLDTIASFSNVQGVYVANNETELHQLLDDIDSLVPPLGLNTPERASLVDYINSYL
ncbi:hypothetical protein L4C33_22080 [Vibrio makurazakiensis]|uniref:glycosyltransferase n=1 Tax=Vibrio makurazakiensis TaxID=2910250 RepID=UPI003D097AF5